MDLNKDSSFESSFDWKDSCFKHDMVRRVHSTPLMPPDFGSNSEYHGGLGRQKKLFVSFRKEVVEDYEMKPALSYRSLNHFKSSPEVNCIIQLCRRRFYCNAELLQQFSALFKQLDIPIRTDSSLLLNSDKQIYPNTFWIVYQWMSMQNNKDSNEFINLHWVAELYLASKYLIIQDLQDACYRYLTDRDKVKEEKAFFLFLGLERYDAKDLSEYLVSLIQGSFTALAGTQDFLDLTCDQILQILYSEYIVVTGEIEVFYAGIRWLLDHIEEREIYAEEVMSTVRFHFMDLKQLLRICREFPRITGKSPISIMVEQAVRIAVLKEVELIEIREKYLKHLPKPRNSLYKPYHEQVESYRGFIHLSRRRREKNSRIYHNLNRLNFPKSRFVEEMESLYRNWKINNTSWESIKPSTNIRRKMSNTYC